MISILPESNYAAVMTETVEPYLDSRRQEMDIPLSTGGTLHAEVYEQPDATKFSTRSTLSGAKLCPASSAAEP